MNPENPVDHRGTTINIGDYVCYNYSGQIALGIVQSCQPAIKDGWKIIKRAKIKIKMKYPRSGPISEVRDCKNVMVIFEDDP